MRSQPSTRQQQSDLVWPGIKGGEGRKFLMKNPAVGDLLGRQGGGIIPYPRTTWRENAKGHSLT